MYWYLTDPDEFFPRPETRPEKTHAQRREESLRITIDTDRYVMSGGVIQVLPSGELSGLHDAD